MENLKICLIVCVVCFVLNALSLWKTLLKFKKKRKNKSLVQINYNFVLTYVKSILFDKNTKWILLNPLTVICILSAIFLISPGITVINLIWLIKKIFTKRPINWNKTNTSTRLPDNDPPVIDYANHSWQKTKIKDAAAPPAPPELPENNIPIIDFKQKSTFSSIEETGMLPPIPADEIRVEMPIQFGKDNESVGNGGPIKNANSESPVENLECGDFVQMIWLIEKLRKPGSKCTMNELIVEVKKEFSGIENIKKT